MSDICISIDGSKVNLRVGALMVREGSTLLCRLPGANWWFVPGGRVKVNETSWTAIERELTEEIGPSFRVRAPRVVSESFFHHEGVGFHEICTYYRVDWVGGERFEGTQPAIEEFEWIPGGSLASLDVRPSFLKRIFERLDAPLELIINKDQR